MQIGKHTLPLRGIPLALLAVAVAAGAAYAYLRWKVPGQLLRVAAVGPVVFVALFALVSPVSAVVLPNDAAKAEQGVARASASHPPVVMLMLDEFPTVSLLGPDGKIDAKRYPNFAALAGGSTWYRNATGVSGWTPYAMPAMLSGRYPQREVAPHYAAYPDNLFTLLGGLYDMDVQESITELCPPTECDRARRDRGGLPVLLNETAGPARPDRLAARRAGQRPGGLLPGVDAGRGRQRVRADRREVPLGHARRQPAVPVHRRSCPG